MGSATRMLGAQKTYRIRTSRLLGVGALLCISACSGGGQASIPLQPSIAQVVTTPNSAHVTLPTAAVATAAPPIAAPTTAAAAFSNAATAHSVPVALTFLFGAASVVTQSHAQRRFKTDAGYSGYTSTAAPISISLNVTPLGGSVSNYTGSCTATATGTSGACTIAFSAAPGPTTFAGTITESSNTIASFSQITVIQPNIANTINFTANPVVNSVSLQLAASAVNAGAASDTLVTVNALDANGNIIAGNAPYVDTNGQPVSFILGTTNIQAGGAGTVSIKGPPRITAPGQAAIYAHYDGQWLDHADISIKSTSSTVMGLTSVTLTTIPHAYEYTVIGSPKGVTTGPDGNIWFAENSANAIGKMSPSGSYVSYSCAPCSTPADIRTGPDGNIYFDENGPGYVDMMTLNGVSHQIAHLSVGGLAQTLVAAPDGAIWVGDSGTGITRVALNGQLTTYAVGGVRGIGLGPDNNIWYIRDVSTLIGKMSLSGSVLGTYTIGATGTRSYRTVTGPDGNVWSVSSGSSQINRVTVNGTVTSYNLQSGAAPYDIAVGNDGYLWFTEYGTNSIGRISPSGTLTEYGATYGISASSGPFFITLGPDGNIWFSEITKSAIVKFVL